MNTVVNKMKTSMLILFAVGSALADVAPLYTTPNAMPGDAPIMTNTQEYVDAKVDSIPEPDFSTSNVTLVATIKETSPAPGNYAVVSNAAMNAVQPSVATNIAEAVAASATNGLVTANGVAAIVTNEVLLGWHMEVRDEYGTWMVAQDVAQFSISNLTWSGSTVSYIGNGEQYSFDASSVDFLTLCRDGSVYVYATSELAVAAGSTPDEWTGLYIGTDGGFDGRPSEGFSAAYQNALGLARLGDLPTKPSDIGAQPAGDYAQASVLADIAETATNALETAGAAAAASSTNSANIATLNAQVASIGAHINAEDAHFVSTNYDSAVRLPEAYVEIKIRDQATGSNTWITIWQEMRRWTAFVGSAFDWQTWQGFHTWATNITQELSFKAERCWGIYDSETGGYSPEGYTQISSSNILVAAGMAYQRTITSDGAVWVLQCNQGVAHIGGDTNGFFRVVDGDGVTQFEIVKGDRREIGSDASGVTYADGTLVIRYSVEAAEHPTIRCCGDLATANWKDQTDDDCPCWVAWHGTSGAWVARVTPKTAQPSMFVKATYMVGGETYIRNAAPISVDGGILCTDGIHKVRLVYNNGTVTLQVVQ